MIVCKMPQREQLQENLLDQKKSEPAIPSIDFRVGNNARRKEGREQDETYHCL